MKIIQNCRNPKCLAKNSMIKSATKLFYKIKREQSNFNSTQKFDYPSWKYQTLFYICRECGFMSQFKSNDFRGGPFTICLVSKDEESKIDEIKSMKKPRCAYCDFQISPMNPQKKEKTQDNIIKLWLNDEFFGYYCRVHRLAFCKKIQQVKWENIDENYRQPEAGYNVLDPINSLLSKYTRRTKDEVKQGEKVMYELDPTNKSIPEYITSKKDWFDEEKCLLIKYVEFEKITCSDPTEGGASFGEPNIEYHTIGFPRRKSKRLISYLVNHGCVLD